MPTVRRSFDWRSALLAWAHEVRGQPYEWGVNDCAALPRAALAVMFGRDVAPDVAPWSSASEAVRRLDEVGGVDGVMRSLGASPVNCHFLCSGAVVVEPDPESRFAAVYVYVEPILVTSHPDVGVEWCDRGGLGVDAEVFNLWEVQINGG